MNRSIGHFVRWLLCFGILSAVPSVQAQLLASQNLQVGCGWMLVFDPAQTGLGNNALLPGSYNWLTWGAEKQGGVGIRELLAHPTFAQSIENSSTSKTAADRGAYMPLATYCSKAVLTTASAVPGSRPPMCSVPAGPRDSGRPP